MLIQSLKTVVMFHFLKIYISTLSDRKLFQCISTSVRALKTPKCRIDPLHGSFNRRQAEKLHGDLMFWFVLIEVKFAEEQLFLAILLPAPE